MGAPKYKFSWTKKFGVPAQRFGEWLHSLEERTAENIVEQARNKKCIAHALFEWNDTAAARAYRIRQAQEMVASLEVEIVTPKQEITRVRAFITSKDHAAYVVFPEATDNELDFFEQRTLKEMARMRHRWECIRLARGVISSIDDVLETASRMRKKKRSRKAVAS